MLKFIKRHLEGGDVEYKKVVSVYFEPWQYEYSDHGDLLFASLEEIMASLGVKGDIKMQDI